VAEVAKPITGRFCAEHENAANRYIAISEAEASGLRRLLEAAREYRRVSLQEHPGDRWWPAHNKVLEGVIALDPPEDPRFGWEK
jgi:hypothetical protein